MKSKVEYVEFLLEVANKFCPRHIIYLISLPQPLQLYKAVFISTGQRGRVKVRDMKKNRVKRQH